MHWNYRVTRREVDGEVEFTIREVYYDIEKPGDIGWTESAIAPSGETLEELLEDLERMRQSAVDLKVIDITDESNPKEL